MGYLNFYSRESIPTMLPCHPCESYKIRWGLSFTFTLIDISFRIAQCLPFKLFYIVYDRINRLFGMSSSQNFNLKCLSNHIFFSFQDPWGYHMPIWVFEISTLCSSCLPCSHSCQGDISLQASYIVFSSLTKMYYLFGCRLWPLI